MTPPPESISTSSSATGAVEECDFCGRPVHRATAADRVQYGSGESETTTLCPECAAGAD